MTTLSFSMADFRQAFARQSRVIGAIMLRNMRTRFFGNGLGYLLVIAWPLVHILCVLVIYTAVGRAPPFGESAELFIATGAIPFMAFSYLSRFMMLSLLMTRPLLAFPEVKVIDVMMASAILETLATCVVALLMIILAWIFDIPFWPKDITQAFAAMGAALLLGVGFGVFNGVLMLAAPMWMTVYSLFLILAWIASGVAFVPSVLPEQARVIIYYNPIIHAVEWMREAYFEGYTSLILDRTYLVSFGVASLGLGMAIERSVRGYLLVNK